MRDSLLPRIHWSGTSSVTLKKKNSDLSSDMRITLSDGKQRSAAWNDLIISVPVAGGTAADGEIDTKVASGSSGSYYYAYLVPKTGDDDALVAVASQTGPESGPPGRSAYKYIGALRFGPGTTQFSKVIQVGPRFFLWDVRQYVGFALANAAKDTWYTVDLEGTGRIPAHVCCELDLCGFTNGTNGAQTYLVPASSTPTTSLYSSVSTQPGTSFFNGKTSYDSHPNTAEAVIGWASGSLLYYMHRLNIIPVPNAVAIRGWTDKYLIQ